MGSESQNFFINTSPNTCHRSVHLRAFTWKLGNHGNRNMLVKTQAHGEFASFKKKNKNNMLDLGFKLQIQKLNTMGFFLSICNTKIWLDYKHNPSLWYVNAWDLTWSLYYSPFIYMWIVNQAMNVVITIFMIKNKRKYVYIQ